MAILSSIKRLLAGLRLVPSWVELHRSNGERAYFRLVKRWDGSVNLREAERPRRISRMLVVLESDLFARRLLRIPPRHRITPNLVMASAVDAFPFDVDEGVFAVGERDGKQYVFGLDADQFDELRRASDSASAYIVTGSSSLHDLRDAVLNWLRDGRIRDLLGRAPPLKPASLLLVLQVAVLIGLVWAALGLWASRQAQSAAEAAQILTEAENAASELLEKRRAVFRMATVERALVDLYDMPGGQVLGPLETMISALPSGARIDRIRLSGDELTLSGWGEAPAAAAEQLEGLSMDVQDLPVADRFDLKIRFSE